MAYSAQNAGILVAGAVAPFADVARSAISAVTQNAMGVVRSVHTIRDARDAEFAAKALYFAYTKNEKIAVQIVTLLATGLIERAI